jgi:hypothetical protein
MLARLGPKTASSMSGDGELPQKTADKLSHSKSTAALD